MCEVTFLCVLNVNLKFYQTIIAAFVAFEGRTQDVVRAALCSAGSKEELSFKYFSCSLNSVVCSQFPCWLLATRQSLFIKTAPIPSSVSHMAKLGGVLLSLCILWLSLLPHVFSTLTEKIIASKFEPNWKIQHNFSVLKSLISFYLQSSFCHVM